MSPPPLDKSAPSVSFRKRLAGGFTHVPRTMGLVWKASPIGTLTLGVLTAIASLLPIAMAAVGKWIVDAVIAKNAALTVQWICVEAGLVALKMAEQRGYSLIHMVVGTRLGININVAILEKALTLELTHFEDPDVYDRLTRARREASARPIGVVLNSFGIVQNIITLVGYVILIASYSGWIVIGLVAATIPATIAEVKFGEEGFRLRNWRSPDTRKLNYIEYVLANDEYAKEVKVFGFGRMLLDRYKGLGEKFYKEDVNLAVRKAGWAYALSLLAAGAFYGSFLSMGLAAAAGLITLGQMTLYVASFQQGQTAFQTILGAIGGMYEDNLYMSNLFDFLEMDVKSDRSDDTKERISSSAIVAPPHLPHGLVFQNVGFKYPGRDSWALRHIDLTLPLGHSVALVGHNGAGKTTFIKLLTRLYEPTEGRIFLDGKDLSDYPREEVQNRIGVVFQDFGQYKLLARETVGIGNVPQMTDVPKVTHAVELGGATEVVDNLPDKLETQLGRSFKGGVELSGGQWQKLALSRAFMREGADILVLDEPTAALDAEAEHAVFKRFQRLAQGKTSIVISHRFPTVRLAEQIIVLEKGGIVEQGTHEELVAKNGLYARLFSLQAQGYL
ncbi:MAG: ABC transporter ATP-binding protein [Polyangiaceae bacterium]|nr:ABC transporter ATP-binding protein [Polyangiaceae bacterium]